MRSTITLSGNLTSDVTLRSTAGGAVANFRMAVNDDWFDKRSQTWKQRSVYISVAAWRQLGENVAASLALGQPVIVTGCLRQRQYDKDGQTHTVIELVADAIGHDLAAGRAVFARTPRGAQTSDVAEQAASVVVEHDGVAA